jgi:hypothetical protein
MRVMILAEDYVRDEHLLRPIVMAMMCALGQEKAKVVVCRDPRFHGKDESLHWDLVRSALERHKGMVDLFLLCVDRDGKEGRRAALDGLEQKAGEWLKGGRVLLGENAWQEVEVWLLAGHDLPAAWKWPEIRNEIHPKENYYVPFAKQRGVLTHPFEGRKTLAQEAAKRYDRIGQLCKEDVLALEQRVASWLKARP